MFTQKKPDNNRPPNQWLPVMFGVISQSIIDDMLGRIDIVDTVISGVTSFFRPKQVKTCLV